jgi:hypothetical protein
LILAAMRWLALALVLAVTAIAHADPPAGDGDAGELFQRGRQLVKDGRITEACALFDRSYALDPAPGTAVNLADCLEHQGQLRRAWVLFDRVARSAQGVQSRIQLARQRADALAARLATIVVSFGDPGVAGLEARLGELELVPAREVRALVDPGDIELVATAPGKPPFRAVVHATAGATALASVPAMHEQTLVRRQRSRVYLAGALGVAGAAGLGISLGFALAARRANSDAYDHGCMHTPPGPVCTAEGRRLLHLAGARADLATGFVLGGALLAGAGATVFLTASHETVIAPVATSHELGIGIVGSF